METLEHAAINCKEQMAKENPGASWDCTDVIDAFKAGAEWQKKQPITFNCIGKQVTMTVQQLIDYYIDSECADVADECGF